MLPISLVLAPTRELALQIFEEARKVKLYFNNIFVILDKKLIFLIYSFPIGLVLDRVLFTVALI
jgi:superfamily II DNA/RNA helicase